ncbi:hypothetical protein K3X13_07040 [Aliiroseovarius crassostreae]|uniref:hypothetical protein n=1 Tax=Aliiroseovarius crassostreae TaxID=154981 RepID=UPI00220B88FC|nr:hypothetical protein [Aliiroseovarius crassostreae]UWP93565.1 hypothetical protein K3X13_07040 [Aliiroseovarius crassostreae]UWQ05895.1 hypothetical protein K3X22_05520 [Aliiroseovarius crassostreae]UWQ09352.1 hypothetical protein K3X25_07325 [Aliiroseovarius crassostreae]
MGIIAALFAGAAIGAWRAHKRGGTGFDLAQYAAVHGIIFALLAIFASVIFAR